MNKCELGVNGSKKIYSWLNKADSRRAARRRVTAEWVRFVYEW